MAIAIDIGINLIAEFKQSKSIDNIKRIQRNQLKLIEISFKVKNVNQSAIQVNSTYSKLQQPTTNNSTSFFPFLFSPHLPPK